MQMIEVGKQQLEELIRRERAIGNYIFDEERKCFFCDAEIALYITKIADNLFKNVCYYMDGYEVYVDEGEEETYEGDEAAAKQKAIDSFNTDKFLGYPISNYLGSPLEATAQDAG